MMGTPPGAANNPGSPPNAMTMPANNPMAMQQPGPPQNDQLPVRESSVSMDSKLLDLQKQTEKDYVEKINQLQTLKLQREIQETNQAIATSRLATVTADKGVSDLLTKPTQPVNPPGVYVPPGAYAAPLVNPVAGGTSVTTQTTTSGPMIPEPPYTVLSVSMELGKWNAIIGFQGKLFNVSIGDVLPIDGSVVTSINKNAVHLIKDGKRRKISIISSM